MKTKRTIGKKQKSVPSPKGRGRPAIYRNEEERREADRLRNHAYQTSDEYKERRKQRYVEDEDYREAARSRARAYALSKQEDAHIAYKGAVNDSLRTRKSTGVKREVFASNGKSLGHALTYSIPECAAVINRPPYVVREWINSGRFPAPRLTGKGERGPVVNVYTDAQVVGFAKAAILHLRIGSAHLNVHRAEAIIAFVKAMHL
jgi:hypothetical protein